jgi:hypothetical protein
MATQMSDVADDDLLEVNAGGEIVVAKLGGLVDESPANFYLFFYSGGILKIRRAKKKRKNKRTTD